MPSHRKFHGYKVYMNYLDYFIKVDVARRDGNMHMGGGSSEKKDSSTAGGEPEQLNQV